MQEIQRQQPQGLDLALRAGVSIDNQMRELRMGMDVVVGTPGRVIDLMERGKLDLSQVRLDLVFALRSALACIPVGEILRSKRRVSVWREQLFGSRLTDETLPTVQIKFFILDEADMMLSQGFDEEVERILQGVPTERQTMLFSATMPSWVKRLTRQHLTQPVMVDLVGDTTSGRLNEDITCARNPPTLRLGTAPEGGDSRSSLGCGRCGNCWDSQVASVR